LRERDHGQWGSAGLDEVRYRRARNQRFTVEGGAAAITCPECLIEAHEGHKYVVLRNVRGALAVYRVRNDGMLKRMKRWPVAIDGVLNAS
jgi:hypothetical protein